VSAYDPLRTCEEVVARYRGYLETTFYFRDPALQRSFKRQLDLETDAGGLVKGPYLEATPVFVRGTTPREVLRELGIDADDAFLRAIEGDRPLYRHQEQAIRRVAAGRNVVVATGTGSGKTEAFLLPILFHLYREFVQDSLCPGVRAIILYPMNALSNDQRDRLGHIAERLERDGSPFRFTFGQYIGETPESDRDSRRHAQRYKQDRFPGELVLREEIRSTPPHILLTNYSMLEYLLIRPGDSPLFDSGMSKWWHFLILDEAHQYRGTRGTEMAMLVRRLKERLRQGGCLFPIQCMATSATLVGGQADHGKVGAFASGLFDEPFSGGDVITGETEDIPVGGSVSLSPGDYRAIEIAVESGSDTVSSDLGALADRLEVPLPVGIGTAGAAGCILAADRRSSELRRLLTAGPARVDQVAQQVFSDVTSLERRSSLMQLVRLLAMVPNPLSESGTKTTLLAARYHLFLRSLEGALIHYLPERQITLNRKRNGTGACFELGLCRECGQHYLVGRMAGGPRSGIFVEAIRDPSHSEFGVDFLLPLDDLAGVVVRNDAGEETGDERDQVTTPQGAGLYNLCLYCGAYWREGLPAPCEHGVMPGAVLRTIRERTREEGDSLPRCAACGYRGPDPVKEVVHGAHGPTAVIATTLIQQLPGDRRKVLAFTDGRQEAAFFAWYLGQTYEDVFFRNLMMRAARKLMGCSPEGLSLGDLADELCSIMGREGLGPPEASPIEQLKSAWRVVLREFLTSEKRISLEGTGLGRWTLRWPPWFRVPSVLLEEPWQLSETNAYDLMLLLLDTLREVRAVQLPNEGSINIRWDQLDLYPANTVRVGERRGEKHVVSWDGARSGKARLLARMLQLRGLSPDAAQEMAVDTLRKLWQAFTEFERALPDRRQALLLHVEGGTRQLNSRWWRFEAIDPSDRVYTCDRCGKLQFISQGGVCQKPACPGMLHETSIDRLQFNHYREMYQADLPGLLRVEEHTAQLSKERAREFQRAFKDGHINVLSSSTTFELGVDLGDLDTVFLRNVPPEPFNYTQRVGRAGRRVGHCGLAISYCRRAPHDLYHFAHSERMLKGLTSPPVLQLRNHKILLRHVTAVVLSRFFRTYPNRFGNVEHFFVDLAQPRATADVREFAQKRKAELERALRSVVPKDMWVAIGLQDESWVDWVACVGTDGQPSRLLDSECELAADYRRVRQIEDESSRRRQHGRAQWAKKRANDLQQEDILSFLSRKAVIPKYGFPVDVVSLDTQGNTEVDLQRDRGIAIAEYAPTAQVVANKKIWESCGIKIVPERPLHKYYYRRCSVHNRFDVWDESEGEAPPNPSCCDSMTTTRKYIIPWFGFVSGPDGPKPLNRRPDRLFSSRAFFISLSGPRRGIIDMPTGQPLIRVTKACPGRMGVICEGHRGQGFYVCFTCGAGFRRRESSHRTPQDKDTECFGRPELVMLGHEFITDIVRLDFLRPPSFKVWNSLWLAYSLAYAIAGAASEKLEVPPTDLSATVGSPESGGIPPIILYDNVPGGAALVASLEDDRTMRECLEAALARVDGRCGCGDDDSCYGCLRSYSNQFAHTHLRRGPVRQFLGEMLDLWRP
jgi:superfamily II DNA/RNA helicase